MMGGEAEAGKTGLGFLAPVASMDKGRIAEGTGGAVGGYVGVEVAGAGGGQGIQGVVGQHHLVVVGVGGEEGDILGWWLRSVDDNYYNVFWASLVGLAQSGD